jgi:predicted MFS family arabinose efflux permease
MSADGGAPPLFSRRYLAWLLFLLFLVEAVGFMERVIIQTIGQSIKQDLALSDLQIGLLSGISFALLYSTLGLPIARLVERYSRVTILSMSVGLFSAAALLCGTARSYGSLLGFRFGVGAGEAGLQPCVVSLVSDHFRPDKRSAALTIALLGLPFGSLLGALGGGLLAEHLSWRVAFIVVAAPGLVVALLVRLTLREPPRGYSDDVPRQSGPPPPISAVIRTLARQPGFRFALAGVAFASMGIGAMGAFTHPFLVRTYHISIGHAAVLFGISSAVAVSLGLVISGFGSAWLSKRGLHWFCAIPALGTLLAAPLYVLSWRSGSAEGTMILVTVASFCSITYQTPTIALFQNIVEARMRATVAFVFFCTSTLVGQGAGPAVFGLASDYLAQAAFDGGAYRQVCVSSVEPACSAASASGIRDAGYLVGVFMLLAATQFALAGRSFLRSAARAKAL